ncbi:unnamed protein product [Discosporangium mesarthrocarpum]
MKPLRIIAAVGENGVIGCRGRLPWHVPADRRLFLERTRGGVVIMGRSTFEVELKGQALAGCINIVLSSRREYRPRNAYHATSLSRALCVAERLPGGVVWVAGGRRPFEDALPLAQRLHLTLIHRCFVGDVHFPSWRKHFTRKKSCNHVNGSPSCTFFTYER